MKTIHDDAILQQCIFESNQWARLLTFLKQENAYCKSRLAEVVATMESEGNLIEAEEFNEMCRQSRRIWEERCNAEANYQKFYQQLKVNSVQ